MNGQRLANTDGRPVESPFNTVNSALRTMARGALGESGLRSDDAIERQLSHSERNNVRATYIHTSEHLDERR